MIFGKKKASVSWTLNSNRSESVIDKTCPARIWIKEELQNVLSGKNEYLTLAPDKAVGGYTFIQTCVYDSAPELLHVEAGVPRESGFKILAKDCCALDEALEMFMMYFEKGAINTDGWYELKLN